MCVCVCVASAAAGGVSSGCADRLPRRAEVLFVSAGLCGLSLTSLRVPPSVSACRWPRVFSRATSPTCAPSTEVMRTRLGIACATKPKVTCRLVAVVQAFSAAGRTSLWICLTCSPTTPSAIRLTTSARCVPPSVATHGPSTHPTLNHQPRHPLTTIVPGDGVCGAGGQCLPRPRKPLRQRRCVLLWIGGVSDV